MKTYQVILTKSYAINISANSAQRAKWIAEFFTGDIKDISADEDRKKINFSIKEIKCVINESSESKEAEEG